MPLRFFCLFGMIRTFTNPFYSLCNGIGKPRLPFKWTVLYFPANALLMFLGVKYFGALGAIQARLLLPVFMIFTLGWEILSLVKVRYWHLVKSVIPALVSCFFMSLSVLSVQFFSASSFELPLIRLMIQIPVGVSAYVLSMLIFFRADAVFLLDKSGLNDKVVRPLNNLFLQVVRIAK
jgi:O-antigen/teichoic acid export membrane protein